MQTVVELQHGDTLKIKCWYQGFCGSSLVAFSCIHFPSLLLSPFLPLSGCCCSLKSFLYSHCMLASTWPIWYHLPGAFSTSNALCQGLFAYLLVFLGRVVSIDTCRNIKGVCSDFMNTADQWSLFVLASFGLCTWAIKRFHEEWEESECLLKLLSRHYAQSCFHSGWDGADTSLVLPCEFSLTFLIVNNCHGMWNALLFRETIILPHTVLTSHHNQLTNAV